ncbi:MAG TPA: VCBS repeat-containing protein [Cytophagales bacterium]|nr:VCBS repeat-containing protein [Cytophagales bacterium]
MRYILISLFLILFISCNNNKDSSNELFTLLSSDDSGITFENKLTTSLENNIFEYEYFYNGGGVGAADFNNDGLTDLFFSGNQVPSKLYLNKGDLKFKDVTEAAGIHTRGWGTGVVVADINYDGWNDLYVTHAGLHNMPNQLFVNLGKQADNSVKFVEKAKEFGLDYKGYSTHAAFFDYDKDGDLDLYILTHDQSKGNLNFPKPKISDGSDPSTDKLFRNDSKAGQTEFKFTDITTQAGITMEGFGLGLAICDINRDGWEDIYVSNDFIYDDLIYINNQDGTFSEKGHELLRHTSRFSMGCDVADFNNDSYPDIVVLDMLPDENRRQKLMNPATNNDIFNYSISQGYLPQYTRNMLQLNNGPDIKGNFSFSEIGQLAEIYKTDWSWSPLIIDLDNDGWKDLFVSNGIPKDVTNHDFLKYKHLQNKLFSDPKALKAELLHKLGEMEDIDRPNFAFQNKGNLKFEDIGKAWGLATQGFSNGTAYADLDNDGDLELITNNLNAKSFIYENRSNELLGNNYLRIRLDGKLALGTKVRIVCEGKEQFLDHHIYRGFQSTQENVLHFGLGKSGIVDTVEIIWPDGRHQVLNNVSANQIMTINYDSTAPLVKDFDFGKNIPSANPAFAEITERSGIDFTHKENNYEDFNYESLLPHRYSRNGPYLASGDVDGNGTEDFWIGGPVGIAGKVYFQQSNGLFEIREMPDPQFEDMGGLFFDADDDRDLDLYIVSGGNEMAEMEGGYQDRLYMNDGKGNFTRNTKAIPEENTSGSIVAGNDFDGDGDLDLFVGGRVTPGNYPQSPLNYILQNNGQGIFEDVTATLSPELQRIGMITSAQWVDFDQDDKMDLVVAGEWTPVCFFKNENGKLVKLKDTGIEDEKGWWFSLAAEDLDNDGDVDFVAGNLGLNSKLKASKKEPVSLHTKEASSGKFVPVLACYIKGKKYTLAGRDQISEYIPSIRSKFNTYEKFGLATYNEIFSNESDEELNLEVTNFSSVILENKGNGKFDIGPLPSEAQFSAVQSIMIKDFDQDGNHDLLIGGNFYSPDFITGRYDASIGLFLKGNGKGEFTPLSSRDSGINLKGDVRSLLSITLSDRDVILSAPNSGKLQVLEVRN